jgi:hypothetical protein
LQFLIGDEYTADALRSLLGMQQRRSQHAQSGRQARVLLRQRRQHQCRQQSHLARLARIASGGGLITPDHQRTDHQDRGHKWPSAQTPTHIAEHRHQRVRPRASLGHMWLVPALAHHTDQQAHPQGGQQADPLGRGVHDKRNIIRI